MNFSKETSFGANSWRAKTNKSDLPYYYKDKPFKDRTIVNLNTSHRRKKMLFNGFILSIFFYGIYYLASELKNGLHFNPEENISWKSRQDEVKSTFLESWKSYEKYAWGKDVYHPISKTGKNMGPKPLGWMIVDSLDTLMIMGLDDEVAKARDWVKNDLTYDFDYNVNTFETTIRMLGGFLSAFYLSKDDIYLNKATDLGNRLLGAFDSGTGVPYASINLKSMKGIKSHSDGGASSTAEVATLQLEFKYLARLTGESLYWKKVEKVMKTLDDNEPKDGLVPIYVQPDTGKYQGNLIRLGSRGDSYYEYLLKQHLQTNQQESIYNEMYHEAVQGIKTHMTGKSQPNKLTYIGELEQGIGGNLSPKMDHLVCFMGGLLALGATGGLPYDTVRKSTWWSTNQEADLMFAKEITYTCYKMYHDVETGLAPEIVVFNTSPGSKEDFHIKPNDKHNLQRPETVESLYVLYKITKDPIYRKWGWEIFESFKTHTKIETGKGEGETSYTSLDDVTQIPPRKRDNMESFWFAETLKYLYLLFEDDDSILPLDQVVFNTEAHPFPRFDLEPLFHTGWERKPRTYKTAPHKSESLAQQYIQNDSKKGFSANIEKSTKEEKKANEPPKPDPIANLNENQQEKPKILADKDSITNKKPTVSKEEVKIQLDADLGSQRGSGVDMSHKQMNLKDIPKAADPDKSAIQEAQEEVLKNPKLAEPEDKEKINQLLDELQQLAEE